jgi:outer membrane PBP1 activator LpoA protein
MRQVMKVVGQLTIALTLAGCSESPPETGTVEFKATTSPEIEAFTKRMSENAKGKVYTKKTTEPAAKPADAKSGETKPAADAKKE